MLRVRLSECLFLGMGRGGTELKSCISVNKSFTVVSFFHGLL